MYWFGCWIKWWAPDDRMEIYFLLTEVPKPYYSGWHLKVYSDLTDEVSRVRGGGTIVTLETGKLAGWVGDEEA